MGHELTVSCVTSGRLDDETGSYDIRDGTLSVDDTETARELVGRYPSLSWADEPPAESGDAADSDETTCAAETCSREVDPDEKYCWQHPT